MREKPEGPLTREDFESADDYARYCRESGIEPFRKKRYPSAWLTHGVGPNVDLLRAIHGAAEPEQLKAQISWGVTKSINDRQFDNAYEAVAFANRCGRIMNVHMTIAWSTVGVVDDDDVAEANKRFLELFGKWCDGRGLPRSWIYVAERSRVRGLHLHIVANVPRDGYSDGPRSLTKWAQGCIRTVTGRAPLQKRGAKEKTIVVRHKEETLTTQWALFRYVMKGLAPDLTRRDSTDRRRVRLVKTVAGLRTKPQGRVTTKRVGTSRQLGASIRKAVGFESEWAKGRVTKASQLYTNLYILQFEMEEMIETMAV